MATMPYSLSMVSIAPGDIQDLAMPSSAVSAFDAKVKARQVC